MFKNKRILITGGTGSWGQELTKKLLESQPQEIRILSRNEAAQVNMQRRFDHPAITCVIADVRDYQAVLQACSDIDYVFHLAALKHVPICEMQPDEALKTNVTGTENIIRASIQQNVQKVIDVSTDKAVDPVNFYGMTKAFGEKLMIRADQLSPSTRFVCIRGGNVLGTNGSVVPFFKNQILSGQDLTLTSKEMTRFFLTVSKAIELLLKAAQDSIGGEIFVMQMKACRIIDLAHVMIQHLSEQPVNIKEIGIRPGEKLHEVLVSDYEAGQTHHYDDHYFVILPHQQSSEMMQKYAQKEKVSFTRYDSSQRLMSPQEITDLLKQGGFLE